MDHFQILNAIAIAIQNDAIGEQKEIFEDLLRFSQSLLFEIHATKGQRETTSTRFLVHKEVRVGKYTFYFM